MREAVDQLVEVVEAVREVVKWVEFAAPEPLTPSTASFISVIWAAGRRTRGPWQAVSKAAMNSDPPSTWMALERQGGLQVVEERAAAWLVARRKTLAMRSDRRP
jgi:hypothetical protein